LVWGYDIEIVDSETNDWLARVRHDLIKRALWAARDLEQSGGKPGPQDWPLLRRALHDLCDDEGKVCDAQALWAQFVAQAPPSSDRQRLLRVTKAIANAQTIAAPLSCPGDSSPETLLNALLQLGAAFAELSAHTRSPHPP
jgi:hypothetical protein